MKKKVIFTVLFVISILILIFLSLVVFNRVKIGQCLEKTLDFAEKNKEIIFSIDKCTLFSGVDTKNKASSITNFTIENLYQYTDMAFFINNHSDENNMENTLKSVNISNIQFTQKPQEGEPSLYYKNINNFAKSEIVDSNKIDNELNFEISSEDNLNFEKPELYNNCASPIVFSYINSNIKTDYTFTDTSTPITYDGSLLKRLNISLDSLDAVLSFDIYITNNLDQKFKTTVYKRIPLQDSDGKNTIYDGKYTGKSEETSYIFYRYQ